VRFGEWPAGSTGASRETLSPIHQRYAGRAPVYLQGGGREALIDMIFACELVGQGCDVTLDVWPDMTISRGTASPARRASRRSNASEPLSRIIRLGGTERPTFATCGRTEVGGATRTVLDEQPRASLLPASAPHTERGAPAGAAA
jgi:hypothetical protein